MKKSISKSTTFYSFETRLLNSELKMKAFTRCSKTSLAIESEKSKFLNLFQISLKKFSIWPISYWYWKLKLSDVGENFRSLVTRVLSDKSLVLVAYFALFVTFFFHLNFTSLTLDGCKYYFIDIWMGHQMLISIA